VEGSQRESCRPTSRLVLLVPMAKERPVHSRGWFGRTSNFERSLVEVRGVRMGVGMVFPANLRLRRRGRGLSTPSNPAGRLWKHLRGEG
jgi:hypothetical protein